jgi:D-amino-acid oxidase
MITMSALVGLLLMQVYALNNEVRYLTPPQLTEANILQKIICHRPRHVDETGQYVPRIEREKTINGTTIIHDYGHGSGGWTMVWGAAQEAVGLLEPEDTQDIAIVGAGIAGLAAAYTLVKAGTPPKTIIAAEFEHLTSHNAGGLFAHQSSHSNETTRNRVNSWITASLPVYRDIVNGKIPEFAGCARVVPAYFANRDSSDLEACVQAGVLEPAKDVIVDFQNGMRKEIVVYDDSVFIETYCMMAKLRAFLENKGITFVQQEVSDLSEISHRTIFNCAGLRGSALAKEDQKSMICRRGHLLVLQGQQPFNYSFEFEVEGGNYMYIFPKHIRKGKYELRAEDEHKVGILGGTNLEVSGPDEEDDHHARFAGVLQRAQDFFGTNDNSYEIKPL